MKNKSEGSADLEKIAVQDEMLGLIRTRAAENLDLGFCVTGSDVHQLAYAFGFDITHQGNELLNNGFALRIASQEYVNVSRAGLRRFTRDLVSFADAVARKAQR